MERFIKEWFILNPKMNRLQKALAVGVLGVSLFTGCIEQEKPEYVIGTVKKELGTVAKVVKSRGAIFGNESVKISDPTYLLQIQTPQGLYTASVINIGSPYRTLESLALVIEEGSKVKIRKSILDDKYRFAEDKIGYLPSNAIIVISK